MTVVSEKREKERIYFHYLDLLRGFAAFLVVLSHARACLLKDYRPDMDYIFKGLYFVSDFGRQAVILFFVLSGCVVGRIVLEGMRSGTWSWKTYLFDRLTRLYIVLIPALCLTALFVGLSAVFAPSSSFVHTGREFGHLFNEPLEVPLADRLSWPILFGNICYLQAILVPPFGSNSPLWSLSYEFWYYLVFPLTLTVTVPRMHWIIRIGCFTLGIALLTFIGWEKFNLFTIWTFGALAFALFKKIPPGRDWIVPGLWGAGVLTAVFLSVDRLGSHYGRDGGINDYLIGLSGSGFVYFALATQPSILTARITGFFSKFSYSTYLVHLPVLSFIAAVWIGANANRLEPSFKSVMILGLTITGVYLFSYGMFWLTERNTSSFRQWLATKLH